MWGKLEQLLLWVISYTPVFILGLYRFFLESKDKFISFYKFEISNELINVISVIIIMFFSFLLFRNAPKLFFRKLNKQMKFDDKGLKYEVKTFNRMNLNDYTFFLLTLILPLITVDFSSTVSLLICFVVIIFIIALLVNIDYIIACPLFFVSPYKVWKVKMLEASESNSDEMAKEVYVITEVQDFFDRNFKAVKLIKNVYYLTEIED